MFKKFITSALALILLIQPVENAFAQVITTGEDGFITNVQSRGIGSLSAADVREGTGAFTQTHALAVPSGRNGLTPELTLQYSSQGASDMQIAGYGWDLSIPYVERINKHGSEKLFDPTAETFNSSLSGELVVDGSTYRAKVDNGDFITYARSSDEWIATTTDGTVYRFGTNATAQQSDPNDTTKISRWYVSSITDTNGNAITYTYTEDTGVVYPATISYGGQYVITFTTEAALLHEAYNLGFHSERDQRLSTIEIADNAGTFKRYTLAYTAGVNTRRDLLASITETDTLTSVSLPPTTFSYSGDEMPQWQHEDTMDFPEPLYRQDNGVRFGDLNGDGLTDIVRYHMSEDNDPTKSFVIRRVHINLGDGSWDIDVPWNWSDIDTPFLHRIDKSGSPDIYRTFPIQLIDVNGDGLDDFVTVIGCEDECHYADGAYDGLNKGVYLNTGAGFQEDAGYTATVPDFATWNQDHRFFRNNAVTLADINGDGLPDVIKSYLNEDTHNHPSLNVTSVVQLNDGTQWVTSAIHFPAPLGPRKFGSQNKRNFKDMGTRLVDINNDGLLDVLRGYETDAHNPRPDIDETTAYINTGSGFASSTDWIPPLFVNNANRTSARQPVDINGDGLAEILQTYVNGSDERSYSLDVNNGLGWYQGGQASNVNTPVHPHPPFALHTTVGTLGYGFYSEAHALLDFDGDNQIDAWELDYYTTTSTQISGGSTYLNTSETPDLLSTITHPEGGVTTVTYDGFQSTVQQDPALMGDSRVNPIVVTSVTTDDQFGNQDTETYSYEAASYYSTTTDIRDRRFAGFGKVTKTTELGKEITYYHQGNGDDATAGETGDSEARIGQAYRVEVTDLNDNLYRLTHTKYTDHDLGNGATFVAPQSTLTLDYDGDGDYKARAASYTYDTNHGSLLTQVEHGEVSGNVDGTFTDTGTDSRTKTFWYATNASGVVTLHTEALDDHSGNTINFVRYYYDGSNSLGYVDKGNLTRFNVHMSGGNYANTIYTHDSYGNVLTETDPENNTTTYTYDQYNLYPETVTNALNQTTTYEYDYRSGQVSKVTDPNGNITRSTYDGFGRLTNEYIPDPQTSNEVLKTNITYTDTPGDIAVTRFDRLHSNDAVRTTQYFDGFNRLIQSRSEGHGVEIVTDTIYGAGGVVASESLPYEGSGTARTPATTNSDLLTTYTYDPLKRVTAVTNALGTTNTSYDQWQETVTDPENNEKTYGYDAFGRLAQVDEENGASTYTTSYEYRVDDVLTKITDADGNERNLAYDGRGLRTSLEDLHDPADTSFGTWTFDYDDAGNLTSQTDPNGDTTTYTYDDLNRVLTEDSDSTSGTDITYSYDTCTEGIGFLCSATTPDVTTDYAYTYTGAIASEDRTIDSTTYTTSYEYDRQGNQTKIVYPDGSDVIYTYNGRGLIDNIQQRESGQSYNTVISNFDYAPHGLASTLDHANGAVTTRTFDPTALYRLESLVTDTPGTGGAGREHAAIEAELSGFTVADDAPEAVEETKPRAEAVKVELVEEPEPVVAGAATTTEAEEVADENEAAATTTKTTASSTDEVIEEEEEVVFAIDTATTTASTTPTVPVIDTAEVEETHTNSTPAVAETEQVKKPEKPKFIGKSKIKAPIDTPHEARLWQKFHRERLAGLQAAGITVDQKTLNSAKYAKEEFDKHLVEKKYIDAPGQTVKTSAQEHLKRQGKRFLETVIDVLLPAEAEAYLFGTEDFESCSALPCSFNNDVSWGSVTPSIDTGSQIEGTNSLREVATGSGGGGLEFVDQNEDEIYVQFKFFMPSNMSWGPSGYYNILQFDDSSNGTMFWLTVEDWGTARLTMMGDALPWTDTDINLQKGVVNTIELRFKKGASNGDIDIWVNNANESSPDYDGSGALNTGTDNVDDVIAGLTYTPEAISTTYYDDVVIDTAFIGELTGGGGPGAGTVQDLTYTYDAVGNITSITDAGTLSGTNVTNYTYDDLYRLVGASNSNYNRTYAYDALGNITSKSDVGSYSYDGNQGGGGTSYALYDDSVATGWADWSWSSNINPNNTSPVHEGSNSIEAAYTSAWGGIAYHHNNFDTTPYDDLELAVNIGTNTSIELYLYFTDSSHNVIAVQDLENYVSGGWSSNTWHEITVPLSDLGIENYTDATTFHIESSQAVTVNYDDIKFTGGGGGGVNYANPHAATTIGNVTYDYDANGNLISTSDGLVNTWNYRNELVSSDDGSTVVTYGYDHTGQRVKKDNGSEVTVYPFPHYEVKDGDVIKHIYANDMLVATIDDGTLTHVHVDHLGSSNVMSDSVGGVAQLLTYYPFGDTETDTQYGGTDQTTRFTGHKYDSETELTYMGARYYAGDTARFTSQDPVALALGDWGTVQEKTGDKLGFYLQNPQTHNSYSYTANNPLKYVDKNGEYIVDYSAEGNFRGWSGSLGVKFEYENGTANLRKVDIYGGVGKSAGASMSGTAFVTNEVLPNEEAYTSYDLSGVVGRGLAGKTGGSMQADTFVPDFSTLDTVSGIGGGLGAGRSVSVSANSNLRVYDSQGSTVGNILRVARAIVSIINLRNQSSNNSQNHDEHTDRKPDDE